MSASITTNSAPLTTPSLPFSIDEKSFSIWVSKIEKKDKLECLQVMVDTLKQLEHTEMPTDIRVAFLEKIAKVVFHISAQLQKTYLESYFPFSEEDNLKISLSLQCTFEIAKKYALICKNSSFKLKTIFSLEQKTQILLNSIQAMSNVLLYKAILYEKPGKGFWNLCFLFYQLAKQNDVLELSSPQGQVDFISVFKQLLVFELSNTQQFNTKEIYTIFNLLNNLTEQVRLLSSVPEKMINTVPCINLSTDTAPAVYKESVSDSSSEVIYISSLNLVKQLFDLSVHKKHTPYQDKVLVLRLIKTLTMNQSRKNERKASANELLAEIGFDKLIEFLLHKDSLERTKGTISYESRDLSVEERVEKKEQDDLYGYRTEFDAGLSLSESADDVVEYVDSADIWTTEEKEALPKGNGLEPDTNANLIDQSQFGFCLRLKEKGVVIKVGDIIHLLMTSVSIVTVVRRIISVDKRGVIVGVEVLGYGSELLHIMDIDNQGARMACFLVGAEGDESIIIKANEFQNEEHLYVDKNEKILRYKIEKILESSTSIFKHLKVSLS